MADLRRYAPATERNRDPILAVLRQILPEHGLVLEVGSGTGEHAAYFAEHLEGLTFQPSDVDAENLDSIAAWRDHTDVSNLLAPINLDVLDPDWWKDAPDRPDAILNINMIHISPWQSCLNLLDGAGRLLKRGGILYFYGPFMRAGQHTAESNEDFDRWLKAQDSEWGVRDMETVTDEAARHGLIRADVIDMPANNFSVIFEKE